MKKYSSKPLNRSIDVNYVMIMQIQLKYKDGEKTIFVPESASIVTYRQGSLDLLIPGAQAIVVASEKNGVPTALTVTAGKNGFKPPM